MRFYGVDGIITDQMGILNEELSVTEEDMTYSDKLLNFVIGVGWSHTKKNAAHGNPWSSIFTLLLSNIGLCKNFIEADDHPTITSFYLYLIFFTTWNDDQRRIYV